MPHPITLDRLGVRPPLDACERRLLEELAGSPGRVHRIWPGQPGHRSPWVPSEDGCFLVVSAAEPDRAAAAWLRFLIRAVLAPRSAAARRCAEEHGLGGTHRVDGRVSVESADDRWWVLAVANNRVSESDGRISRGPVRSTADRSSGRARGEVVELGAGVDGPGAPAS